MSIETYAKYLEKLQALPDRSTTKGKRDYAIVALLVGYALRRRKLAALTVTAAKIEEGALLRSVNKVRKVGKSLSD